MSREGSGFSIEQTECSTNQASASPGFGADMDSNVEYSSSVHASDILLRLPRELREMIYEFALTFDGEGVHCRPGFPYADLEIEKKLKHDSEHQGIEQFFDTPINLRLFQGENDDMEANQLKYVCRQLHQETKGLELAYNSILFCGEPNTSEKFAQGERFLRICGKGWKRRLQRMIFRDQTAVETPRGSETKGSQRRGPEKKKYTFDMNQSIIGFATQHPKADIHIQIGRNIAPTEDSVRTDFLKSVMISLYARDTLPAVITSLGAMRPEGHRRTKSVSRWIQRLRTMPNFRMFFHPANYRAELLKDILSDPTNVVHSANLPSVFGGVETWLSIYKSWFEKGI